jgi:hypothetical protein
MPLQPRSPPSFCLISPEAGLMTVDIISAVILIKPEAKAGKGLTEKRGGVWRE